MDKKTNPESLKRTCAFAIRKYTIEIDKLPISLKSFMNSVRREFDWTLSLNRFDVDDSVFDVASSVLELDNIYITRLTLAFDLDKSRAFNYYLCSYITNYLISLRRDSSKIYTNESLKTVNYTILLIYRK